MAVDTEVTTDVQLDERVKIDVREPKKWNVIFLNDDVTPMEFVIGVLIELYKHTSETAQHITLQIHEKGSGVAGTYSFDIAEIKAVETNNLARANGFPLQIKLEEE
ncbi:ATP-dependent Clp protease adaptor ClpS [bacterium]|nr:ATP-dependent Clp protease adaptor ClpS [Candidatus Elulimicrobium humile]